MGALDEILRDKLQEVTMRKELYPVKLLEQSLFFQTKPASLKHYLERPDKVGIIAEIKRRSPAKGDINRYIAVDKLSIGYMQAGASALSVLTDQKYFGGSNDDLTLARRLNFCPILRKDFVLEEYQVIEAKSIGADAILLIAALLKPEQIPKLSSIARSLGMQVVLEVHSAAELASAPLEACDVLGVNNRNLDTLAVDVRTSFELASKVPAGLLKISESGLDSADTLMELREAGYRGFLIGEAFMRTSKPDKACAKMIEELKERIQPKGSVA